MDRSRQEFRIVMAVHNAATNDNRVVKSAEALQKAGYDCHVVGTLREPFVAQEVVNGVTYHRVELKSGLSCLPVGLWSATMGLFLKMPSPAGEARGARNSLRTALWYVPLRAVVSLLYATFSALWIALVGVLLCLALFLAGVAVMVYGALALPCFLVSASIHFFRSVVSAARRREGPSSQGPRMGAKTALRLMLAVPYWARGTVSRILRRLGGLAKASSFVSNSVRRLVGRSPFFTWYVRGRYLCSFCPKLVELAGNAYHGHEMWMLQSCVLAARRTGGRFVYDSHELEAHRNAPWSRFVRGQWVRYETKHIRHADGVIAVSDGCAGALREAYGLPEVTVVRNTPLYDFQPAKVGLREKLGLDADTPLIVYVGAVTFNRGIEKVLAALVHLPGYVFATVGPHREDVRSALLQYARCNGLGDRFFTHAKVPPRQVVDFISSADVSISPIQNACLSYYYCLPSKLFESVFAGVPVVASDFPDMRRFITDNEVGLVCDETAPDAIAAGIRQAYESRQTFFWPEKIERIRRENCFEQESGKLVALYDRLFAIGICPGERDAHSGTAKHVDPARVL